MALLLPAMLRLRHHQSSHTDAGRSILKDTMLLRHCVLKKYLSFPFGLVNISKQLAHRARASRGSRVKENPLAATTMLYIERPITKTSRKTIDGMFIQETETVSSNNNR